MVDDILKACGGNVDLAAKIRQLNTNDSRILAAQAIAVAAALSSGVRNHVAHKILGVLTTTGRPASGPVLEAFEDMIVIS